MLPPKEYVPAGHKWQAPVPLRLPKPALHTVVRYNHKAAQHLALAYRICRYRAGMNATVELDGALSAVHVTYSLAARVM
jgi:hypothetical protein